MTKQQLLVLLGTTGLLAACSATAPNQSTVTQTNNGEALTEADFQRAREFMPKALAAKVDNLYFKANWIGEQGDFWYQHVDKTAGQTFKRYHSKTQQISSLFDTNKLAQGITQHLPKVVIDWSNQPLSKLTLNDQLLTFSIKQDDTIHKLACDLTTYQCTEQQKQVATLENGSPNEKYQLNVVNYNLQLCTTATKECKTLTTDGTEQTPYAVAHPYPETLFADADFNEQSDTQVYWSQNENYAVTYKLFRQGVGKLTLTDSVADNDYAVKAVEYYYPQAGDKALPHAQPVLINTQQQTAKLLDIPKVMQTYYGGALWGEWHGDKFYYHDRRRGNREYHLRVIDAKRETARSVITETDPQFIDPWVQTFEVLDKRQQIIWSSQRSGYQHLYLYNQQGDLINPITQGEFTVRVIRGIDQDAGVLYFEASGKESNRDPYLRHLYRVNLDGSGLRLLTPEPVEHSTEVAPDFASFIDTQSNYQTAPKTLLRSTVDGSAITSVQQADASDLLASGWRAPEAFSVLSDDGKTPLYGLIYKPSNFDPNKRYPVIDDTYTGPHNFFTPKSFVTFYNQRPALAELGFIVIKMDGRGTNKRGKAFHRQSYKNLAAGTDDHVWAIKQLAKKHSYMDLNRVGIFGFSAGGYDTMQAMLRHPEFFKAGVSASGNHDFRVDKAGWNEIWMGWPVTQEWQQQSNYKDLERLQGKLLLAHGELDSNVHISATMRLVDGLIKANKDFDLLIMPKMGHVLDNHQYFVEKRWKFFIEHLRASQAPAQ